MRLAVLACSFFTDVNRLTAEIGYWLGEPFWGRGFATVAVKAVTEYAFATFDLQRVQATVFEWNPASARVLERAGYTFEGRLRSSIVKSGRIGDALMYAACGRRCWRRKAGTLRSYQP